MTAVAHNDSEHERLTVSENGMTAELVYRKESSRITLVHTGVPDALAGAGVGGTLVRAAVDLARQEGLVVVPVCPFARQWLQRHPNVAATVEIDWTTRSAETTDR